MAYKFANKELAKLASKARKAPAKRKSAKRRKASKRRKVSSAPKHFPAALAAALGYKKPRRKVRRKTSAKRRKTTAKRAAPAKRRKTTVKRTRKPAKKTAAQLHAFRVKQGKRLAAMRKSQLKGRKSAKRKARK
jgi:hypothetical protein